MDRREALKGLATDFFYWWHNQPGTNTQDGFDEYAETEVGKKHIEAALQSQPAMGSGAEPVAWFVEGKALIGRFQKTVFNPSVAEEYEKLGNTVVPLCKCTNPAPTAQDSDPDWKHPKLQALLSAKARLQIEMCIANDLLDDPQFEGDMLTGEYWTDLHDKIRKLQAAQDSKVPENWRKMARNALEGAELFAGENDYLPNFWSPQLEGMLNELAAAPSPAEKPDHTGQPLAMVADKPQYMPIAEVLRRNGVVSVHGKGLVSLDSGTMLYIQRPQPPEGEQ